MDANLLKYRTLPLWTRRNLPEAFQRQHHTTEGTWAKLNILTGKLKYYILDDEGKVLSEHVYSSDDPAPFVEPQCWHKVEPLDDDLKFYIEFYCQPDEYYPKKYQIDRPHPQVVKIAKRMSPGKVLDIGCGKGQNSFYLNAMGFDVTAFDIEKEEISQIERIVIAEYKTSSFRSQVYDINQAEIEGDYDFMIALDVLQHVHPNSFPEVILNMQQRTNPEGYHLLTLPIPVARHYQPHEVSLIDKIQRAYFDWEVVFCDHGHAIRDCKDENGRSYQATTFSTILRKT